MVAVIITVVVFFTPLPQIVQVSVIWVISKAFLVLPKFLLVHLISPPVTVLLLCTDFILICFEFLAASSMHSIFHLIIF